MSRTIGVCVIAKNEEVLIGRMLESIRGADQVVVVDTGSTDRTIEIAEAYGAEVYKDFIWVDDYALAQNHAKSKMTTDFILSIDCDEYLDCPWSEVQKAVELAENVVRVTMIAEGNGKNDFGFGRLFRNTPDIYWMASIHKHLNVPGEGEPVGNVRIVYGYSPAHLNDPDRSLRMLEHAVATEEKPVRNLYYLGREYWYKQRYQDCIDTLQRYVKVSEWPAEKAEAYMNMGQAYKALGDHQQAAEHFTKAMIINTNFKEVILEMAAISTHENAVQWRRLAKTANNRDVLWKRIEAEPVSDVLFIEPHQDDAALYGFYTLLRVKPILISVTSSFIQPNRGDQGCDADTRRKETIEAAKIAGVPVVFLDIPDTELTEENLRERLQHFNPETVYIPAQHENGNPQHNLIGKVCLELFGKKCEQYCTYVRGDFNIVKGSWEVKPTHNEIELKNKALDCFKSQLALPATKPHFDAVRGKSEWIL